jgi:hypothetical protein
MTPAELRRQYRAARTLHTVPDRIAHLTDRLGSATAALGAYVADEPVQVPGYRVWRDAQGIHVSPVEPTHAAQLALWRAMTDDEPTA